MLKNNNEEDVKYVLDVEGSSLLNSTGLNRDYSDHLPVLAKFSSKETTFMSDLNLWGDLSKIAISNTPKNILKQQANFLHDATSGMLTAEVVSTSFVHSTTGKTPENYIDNSFSIVVPTLNDYRYTILVARNGLILYPVEVLNENKWTKLATEQEFTDFLATILQSPKIQATLSALLSQVSETDNSASHEQASPTADKKPAQ